MKKEIPILFNGDMVRAILSGRKTQTRRAVKWPVKVPGVYASVGPSNEAIPSDWCPLCKPGDLLYVRETWGLFAGVTDNDPYIYRADGNWDAQGVDGPVHVQGNRWKPSIHMPKEAARIWLEVESVRVERLQEISEEDAKAEGICEIDFGLQTPLGTASVDGGKTYHPFKPQHIKMHSANPNSKQDDCLPTAGSAFTNLWQSVYGTWDANPWVWVVSFRVASTTGKP